VHADACLLCVSTASSGHSQQQGDYHYHFPPSCLVAQATAQSPTSGDVAGHSPQIGWAFDGFPVYGPLYTGGQKVSGLDECGGKQEELAALDKFKDKFKYIQVLLRRGHVQPLRAAGTSKTCQHRLPSCFQVPKGKFLQPGERPRARERRRDG
jgi:hypothetical protein